MLVASRATAEVATNRCLMRNRMAPLLFQGRTTLRRRIVLTRLT